MERKYFLIISGIALISLFFIALGSLGFLSVTGWGQTLKNYTNDWSIQDLGSGNEVTEATLKLPQYK
jgi:hypothetical protein